MKKKRLFFLLNSIFLLAFYNCQSQTLLTADSAPGKAANIAYFNPEIFPDLEEIKDPTNAVFFTALSDQLNSNKNNRLLLLHTATSFEDTAKETIKDFCVNNNADFAVIPKVKYFKVGIGSYVFSNQVEISMKLYDSDGNFITESTYNTYKKNARILGSAENSIKIATNGALKNLAKNMQDRYKTLPKGF